MRKVLPYLVGDGAHVAEPEPEGVGQEVHGPRPEVGDGGQPDQRIAQRKGKDPAVQRQPDDEHQRQRDEEDEPLRPAPQPQMTQAGNRPRRETQQDETARFRSFNRRCRHGHSLLQNRRRS